LPARHVRRGRDLPGSSRPAAAGRAHRFRRTLGRLRGVGRGVRRDDPARRHHGVQGSADPSRRTRRRFSQAAGNRHRRHACAMTILDDNRYIALARLVRRHGRSDLLSGAQLDEFDIDDETPLGDAERAEAFADDLEKMGPTFIKLGQLLSTRFDLLPASYTTALERLQDEVDPISFEEVREVVEAELGATVKERFRDFEVEPLAAASLGQVHRATLRNGREVVVKVQRPNVRETVREDMKVLGRLARLADKHTEAGRNFGVGRLLDQFRRSLAGELDYRREARILVTFGELTAPYDLLTVPQPVEAYTTSKILTMDHVEGRKVTDIGQ